MSYDEYSSRAPSRLVPVLALVGACLLVAAFAMSYLSFRQARNQHAEYVALSHKLNAQLRTLRSRNARLAGSVENTQKQLKRKNAGIAPLAARALKSVFTIETADGRLGAGFAAWAEDDSTYFVTANHVVAGGPNYNNYVTVKRKGGTWQGEIAGQDPKNDLAVIRVTAHPAGAEPLWQRADANTPRPGDELLLIGSPYGLEGTVTTGIVSRVIRRYIQTDAAANPGNSGGPAIDKNGHVVGVLVSGGGENLNFAVRIDLVCQKLRDC
jgi:S1-C subfamily serine protease